MLTRSLRLAAAALSVLILACSCAKPRGGQGAASAPGGDDEVEEKVIVEKLPDGRTKKTTVRTTKKTVTPQPPPPRPADPYPADPLVRYNVERLNAYRSKQGLAPLRYDAKISAFAREGSEQLSRDHTAHAHFAAATRRTPPPPGFGTRSAENQGDPRGVPEMDPDPVKNGKAQVDIMMKLMMDEGPGGGHHDNMMNPLYRRVGIGLVYVDKRLYLTNDFSD